MMNMVKNLKKNGTASLPSDMWSGSDKKWAIELLETKTKIGRFTKAHEHLDKMKSRAVFVPDLIMGTGDNGSYALGKKHSDNFILSIKGKLSMVKQYIDMYLLPQLVEYNFGKSAPVATWEYSHLSDYMVELLKDILMEATKTGTAPAMDWDWAFSALGIPQAETEDNSEAEMEKSNINPGSKRPLSVWEKNIDFENIEKFWDNIDNKIINYMEGFISKSKDEIITQIEKMMSSGNVNAEDIKIKGESVYQVELRKYFIEAIKFGMETVKKELNITKDFSISNRTRNWGNTKVNSLAGKQLKDLSFQLLSGMEKTLQVNAESYDKSTVNEAVAEATKNYDSWVNKNIKITAREITSRGINQGRSIAAEGA
jgi:ASC-1-like (ASCH) protein